MIQDAYFGSQIPDLDFFPSRIRILDLGVKKALDPGSGSATLVKGRTQINIK
jgi:hypothetical protein